jgi:hypothetical protein
MCLLAAAASAWPEQMVWIDKELTWDVGDDARKCNLGPIGPDNWKSPVDYYNGCIFFRIEVLEKASDFELCCQICNWSGGETCSKFWRLKFSKPGDTVYTREPANEWWTKSGSHDWTQRGNPCVLLIRQEGSAGKWMQTGGGGGHIYNGDNKEQHFPVKIRFTTYVISKGSVFDPPDEFSWQCQQNWGDKCPCTAECYDGGVALLHAPATAHGALAPVQIGKSGDALTVSFHEKGALALYNIQGKVIFAGTGDARLSHFARSPALFFYAFERDGQLQRGIVAAK